MIESSNDSTQGPSRRLTLGLIAAWLLACIPLLFIKVFPSSDFPNHLARCYILARGDSSYWQFYTPHWVLLPNLALELMVVPLAHIMSIEAAGKVFFAILFAVSIYGGARFNKTLAGQWSFYGLAPAILIYNRVLAYGYVNYLFGVALLPLALAYHIENRDRPGRRFVIDAIFMVLLFTAHLLALVFFVACALVYDLVQMRADKGPKRRILIDVASLLAPFLALGALTVLASPSAGEASKMSFSPWSIKIWFPLTSLRTGQLMWDWVFLALIAVVLVILGAQRKMRFVKSAWPFLVVLILIFIVSPYRFTATSYVDARIPLVGMAIALACLAPAKGAGSRTAGVLFGALLLFRVATTTLTYRFWQPRIDRTVADLRSVPAGSILLAARQGNSQFSVTDGWYPRLRHASCLLLMERPVMASDLFTHPTQQPLLKKSPYDKFDDLPQALGPGDAATLDAYAQAAMAIARKGGIQGTPEYLFYLRQKGPLLLPASMKPVVVRPQYAILRIEPSAGNELGGAALPADDSSGF
jgi:hypothetical protein